nr:adenylate/guanylate cyclase domain-containing protein [Nocardioides marinus]
MLLGGRPGLTRVEVAAAVGVPVEVAQELWRLLGFPATADDDVAFTEADVEALQLAVDLTGLGILDDDSRSALVRTWGRSFARLAEWQTTLMARVAAADPDGDPTAQMAMLTGEVVPRVERLQSYVWRRHLAGAAGRLLAGAEATASDTTPLAVAFVDIVGFTSQSRSMADEELVRWIETFESRSTEVVLDHGGRVIKNIGDEVLLVADTPADAARIVHLLVSMGADDEDPFPAVRAGVAYGDVVTRLGDVLGPTVNIAARLTSLARPGTVLVDDGMHEALEDDPGLAWRRLPRASVKGYSRLQAWALRHRT